MSRKGFASILVVVLIVIVLGAGIWYYKTRLFSQSQNASVVSQESTTTPIGTSASVAPQDQSNSELTPQEDAKITKLYGVSIGGPGNYAVFPSEADLRQALGQLGGVIPFIITNTGTRDDTYAITVNSLLGWGDLSNVPTSVKVASQSKTTVNIPIHLPSTIMHGTEEHIKFLVKSVSAPTLFESVDMTIGVSR
jgi:hypothetical protein